jgi:hypothetical protein
MLKLRPVSTLMPRWLTPVRILGAFIVLALLLEFLIPNAGLSASVAHLGGFIGSVVLFVCSLTLWSKARVQIGRRKLRYKTVRINAGVVAAIGLSFIVVQQTSLKLRNHTEQVRPVAAKTSSSHPLTLGSGRSVLAGRLASRVQLTTDGHRAYLDAVDGAFGTSIYYAMLVKQYGNAPATTPERRYSPAVCLGTERTVIHGRPDPEHISTSYVERQNLTMRMSMRRFTRLTNAFSKKFENHCHMAALYAVWYNFVRIHKTLKVAPAMEAGVSERLMSLEDIVRIVDEWETDQKADNHSEGG